MKLYHQFDLKNEVLRSLGRELFEVPPYVVEELVKNLSRKGYTILKSSANYMGLPKSITVIKEFTGPFVGQFTAKIKDDFRNISKKLGISELFE